MAHGHGDMLVRRQDLQDLAWSAPMRDLASRLGLSDVGLKKILRSHGVITPPQGHWNRVQAGKPVTKCPKVPARRPGETGRVRVDHRFATVLAAVEPIPSAGPFASAAVPEDLDQLYEQELKAIGRVAVPRKLERVHYGLAEVFRKEERRRAKQSESGWSWDGPMYDSPVDQRRLRLLNALFLALGRSGHHASAGERAGRVDVTIIVGNTRLSADIVVAGTHRTVRLYGRERPAPDLPALTPLRLEVDGGARPGDTAWQDDAAGKLEAKLREVAARIIVAGEAKFRRGLKEAEEHREQYRRWQQERRREEVARRDAERLKHLRESGDLLRQAEDLRALVARVRSAVLAGPTEVDPKRLAEWERWASAEADRLDPLLSGQVMIHLAPPD